MITKITDGNAGTYNAACFYLENKGLITDDVDIKFSGNHKRVRFFHKDGKLIAEYREDRGELVIYS